MNGDCLKICIIYPCFGITFQLGVAISIAKHTKMLFTAELI